MLILYREKEKEEGGGKEMDGPSISSYETGHEGPDEGDSPPLPTRDLPASDIPASTASTATALAWRKYRRSLLSRNLAAWTAFRDPMASEEGAKARNLDVLARRFCDVARLEAIVEFS